MRHGRSRKMWNDEVVQLLKIRPSQWKSKATQLDKKSQKTEPINLTICFINYQSVPI